MVPAAFFFLLREGLARSAVLPADAAVPAFFLLLPLDRAAAAGFSGEDDAGDKGPLVSPSAAGLAVEVVVVPATGTAISSLPCDRSPSGMLAAGVCDRSLPVDGVASVGIAVAAGAGSSSLPAGETTAVVVTVGDSRTTAVAQLSASRLAATSPGPEVAGVGEAAPGAGGLSLCVDGLAAAGTGGVEPVTEEISLAAGAETTCAASCFCSAEKPE